MLNERSIKKIGRHLENEGWTDEEITEALNSIDTSGKSVNVVLPLHLKEEALLIAKCHCKYSLKLKEGTPKYNKAFNEAYINYLTEAYENSRGVEGPGSPSVKRENPAGIELHAFDKTKAQIISNDRRMKVSKAPIGLIYMGKDGYLQRRVQQAYDSLKARLGEAGAKRVIVEFVTQYSASVTSLSNTFLFVFGNYQTKRKFSGVKVYDQDSEGFLSADASKPLEFTKKTSTQKVKKSKKDEPDIAAAKLLVNEKSDNEKEAFEEVAYRQITRQIYIYVISSIIAGATALDTEQIEHIENGIKRVAKEIWDQANDPKEKPSLKFLLSRELRDAIFEKFTAQYTAAITEKNPNNQNGWSQRQLFLQKIYEQLSLWESPMKRPSKKK